MANKTIEMFTIRQVLRLHAAGRGTKFIAESTGIARNTVKKYLARFAALRVTLDELGRMDDAEMHRYFLVPEKTAPPKKPLSELGDMLPELAAMLKKRGVTKQMIYARYAAQCPGGYKASSFFAKFNAFLHVGKTSLKMDHRAGDKMFVDFTGQKLHVVDRGTGEVQEVEVFVAILGCSQLTFAMAMPSQQKEDFIMGCEKALRFFGGVPQAIVPDNLRSAVTRASRYEAQLNDSFSAFAEHYGTFGFPTRAYRPKDKALVEGAVKILYTRMFAKVDEKIYHDLEALNVDVQLHVEAHNDLPLTGEAYSRRQQFDELERPALRPLNPYPFELVTVQMSTANKYGHVLLSEDKRYYSVPYQLLGKRLKIRYGNRRVEVHDGPQVVAVHERFHGKGNKYITKQDHLASHHRYLSEWNPEKFMETATALHADIASYISKILSREQYPEQSYKSCSGVLSFAKRVGMERLANACKRADMNGIYNYGIIDQILRSKSDYLPFDDEQPTIGMPAHGNIRGQGYYE